MIAALAPLHATAQQINARQAAAAPGAEQAEGFIVKLRSSPLSDAAHAAPERIGALATRTGFALGKSRHIVSGIHLMRMQSQPGDTVAAILVRLRADPEVEYAELNQRRYAHATPDDPLFSGQWYMQNTQASAVNAIGAWDLTTGSNGVVIAELDTGVRFDHPDLRNATANRLLPGYNMISTVPVANDGDGRDADASDPGDWVSSSDTKNPPFTTCSVSNSSWHGTRIAGILGAATNNQSGIAGMTWSGWILPVRVLGKCGGYDSDILAAMAWAAGIHVDGVPDNPYPARVLNMSLGAAGKCTAPYQQLVDELVVSGVLVVVSAGNEGGPVDAPANCAGVAGVAGLRQVGTKVGFSSLGPEIALSAPAGNCVNTGVGQPCLFSIETTSNSGTTVPGANIYTDQMNFNVGTSFSAPIVAGIAGLMLAVNGNLSPGQLIARLQAGATTPFPVSADPTVLACHTPAGPSDLQTKECNCTTSVCGAGMVNAHGAVLQALRPITAVALPAAVTAGQNVTLDGSGSAAACHASISTYQWTVVSPTSNPPTIQNANTAQATVVAPNAPATYTLMLTVTDDAARTDSTQVTVTSSSASTAAPARAGNNACLSAVSYTVPPSSGGGSTPSSGGGGGGGGALDVLSLLALAGLASAVRRPYSSRSAASSHGRCARR
ncbi:MAG TPA: S8 family serine peptidase [Steroidobacteraceae bacterium]